MLISWFKLYQKCSRILRNEFGVEPQPETVQLYQEILNNQIPAIVVAWGGKETFDTFSRFLDEELEHSASATID